MVLLSTKDLKIHRRMFLLMLVRQRLTLNSSLILHFGGMLCLVWPEWYMFSKWHIFTDWLKATLSGYAIFMKIAPDYMYKMANVKHLWFTFRWQTFLNIKNNYLSIQILNIVLSLFLQRVLLLFWAYISAVDGLIGLRPANQSPHYVTTTQR